MRLGCIRQRHISQRWVTLSIGGIEFINGLDWVRSENTNISATLLLTSGNITKRQVFRFSSKDSSTKSISTTIIASKKNDIPSEKSLSFTRDLDRQSDIVPSTKEVIRLTKSNPSKSEETKLLEMKRSFEARRLIVKRSAMNDLETTAIIKSPLDLRQRIGIVNRRFSLEHEITDSGGKTVWIPVQTIVNTDRLAGTKLPQINASAWLDPSTYCRGGGKTIAGTVAARQLLHGKKNLMEVLGHAVYSSTSKLVQRHRSIILCGHGVPPQLLQHHIDSADKLLLHLNASEVSFKQFNVSQSDSVTAMTDAVRDIRWGHVRNMETGENRVIPWPIDNVSDWEYDLQLYWTVMNRIATRLGLPVLLKQPQATVLPKPETSTRRPRADYNAPVLLNNSMLNVPPHHWRVKFSRDLHFSTDQFPTSRSHLYPVIEWTPLEGVATPGHVCIRLQGQSTNGNGDTPISLSFDASFRSFSVSSNGKD